MSIPLKIVESKMHKYFTLFYSVFWKVKIFIKSLIIIGTKSCGNSCKSMRLFFTIHIFHEWAPNFTFVQNLKIYELENAIG